MSDMCCYYCAIKNVEDRIDWAYIYIEEENIEFYEWICPACIEHNEKDLGVQIQDWNTEDHGMYFVAYNNE